MDGNKGTHFKMVVCILSTCPSFTFVTADAPCASMKWDRSQSRPFVTVRSDVASSAVDLQHIERVLSHRNRIVSQSLNECVFWQLAEAYNYPVDAATKAVQ